MRWFRKAEDNAPRLISLSPLRQLDSPSVAAADAEVADVEWGYQHGQMDVADGSESRPPPHVHRRSRSALSDNVPGDRSSYAENHHHLPCTLKRKPAVRRRSGGKGKFFKIFFKKENKNINIIEGPFLAKICYRSAFFDSLRIHPSDNSYIGERNSLSAAPCVDFVLPFRLKGRRTEKEQDDFENFSFYFLFCLLAG